MANPLGTLEQRVRALEARLAEVEGGYGRTLYRLERRSIGTEIALGRILEHLDIRPVSDDEVDAVLDEDS